MTSETDHSQSIELLKLVHTQVDELKRSQLSTLTKQLSVFLIEAQWIEFQLKTLLSALCLLSNDPQNTFVRGGIGDIKGKTLSKLKEQLKEFEWYGDMAPTFNSLCENLGAFISLRNNYTHHLFTKNVDESVVLGELSEGIQLEEQISERIILLLTYIQEDNYLQGKVNPDRVQHAR